jgi:hypothetical protein
MTQYSDKSIGNGNIYDNLKHTGNSNSLDTSFDNTVVHKESDTFSTYQNEIQEVEATKEIDNEDMYSVKSMDS